MKLHLGEASEGGRSPPPNQYAPPGKVSMPAWRPAALYILTPPQAEPPTPSWSAQLRPRAVTAAPGRRNGEEPSRAAR